MNKMPTMMSTPLKEMDHLTMVLLVLLKLSKTSPLLKSLSMMMMNYQCNPRYQQLLYRTMNRCHSLSVNYETTWMEATGEMM